MNIPLPETGPKVKPLIDEAIESEAQATLDKMTDEQKEQFLYELNKLLEAEQNVLVGERDTKRNKLAYIGHCNGAKEKERRIKRLQSKVYSEGC